MTSFFLRFKNWVAVLYARLKNDVFAMARAKILLSYAAIGVVITAIVGYLIYRNTIFTAEDVVTAVRQMIVTGAGASHAAIASSTVQVINAQIWKESVEVGVFTFAALVICTYVLVWLALRPIKKAMERQRRFAANVAHELRTPLSVMKMNFEVALLAGGGGEGGASDADARGEFREALRTGIEEVDRMSEVAQFLLTFSAFDGQSGRFAFESVDLAAVADDTLHRMKTFIDKRDMYVQVIHTEPIFIQGNATALGELILNLMKNAIAYTPAGGFVTVTVSRERGVPTLSVHDTGIGIPPGDLPNIFEPFYRGSNAYSQRSKKRGTGLGLTLVKEVVVMHKAQISVRSELGKGTTFLVRFPVLPGR